MKSNNESDRPGEQGFGVADFLGRTSRLTAAQRKIEEQKLLHYNHDTADSRSKLRKLSVLEKLINYFAKED